MEFNSLIEVIEIVNVKPSDKLLIFMFGSLTVTFLIGFCIASFMRLSMGKKIKVLDFIIFPFSAMVLTVLFFTLSTKYNYQKFTEDLDGLEISLEQKEAFKQEFLAHNFEKRTEARKHFCTLGVEVLDNENLIAQDKLNDVCVNKSIFENIKSLTDKA